MGNSIAFQDKSFDDQSKAPENTDVYFLDKDGVTGHGSAAACVAGGLNLGVASNANLYLVKWKGAAMMQEGSRYVTVSSNRESLKSALSHITETMLSRRLQGKSVINFSFGKNPHARNAGLGKDANKETLQHEGIDRTNAGFADYL